MKITVKQQKFADAYIETGNAEESAKLAGYSARGNTTKLLQNTTIKNYIENRMKELESEAIAKQDEVLRYLTNVMRREEKEYTVVTLREKEERWVDMGDGNLKKQTIEKESEKIVPIPAKLSDANKAAELLGKRYAMWTDRQQVEGTAQVVIQNDLDD